MEIAQCKRCPKKTYIVNRTHFICQACNRKRLDKQGGVKKKKSYIKARSSKRDVVEVEYRAAQKEIKQDRPWECQGCGGTQFLSFSHLVPRSRRRDLIANKLNIHIHCMSFGGNTGCHDKHDAGQWDQLRDGDEILSAIKALDPEYYSLLIMKRDGHTDDR